MTFTFGAMALAMKWVSPVVAGATFMTFEELMKRTIWRQMNNELYEL